GRLLSGVRHLAGAVGHHHRCVFGREHDAIGPPAGTQVLLEQFELLGTESVSRAWVIWSAVVFTRATSSGSASFRQHVRSTAPIVLPVMGWWIGTPAQARSSRFSA